MGIEIRSFLLVYYENKPVWVNKEPCKLETNGERDSVNLNVQENGVKDNRK